MLIVLIAATHLATGQDAPLPRTAPEPSTRPFVPDGEKPFYDTYINVIPGTRIWVQWLKGSIWHYNTTQSVGDGAGMTIYAPPGEDIGWLCSMDTGAQAVKDKLGNVTRFALTDYKGISLWIKGDGSDSSAVFSTGWDSSRHKFRVPLKDTNWHKVFMAWDDWDEPITEAWYYLTYSIERTDHARANWYIVDRVHFYKERKVEEIRPTPDVDPPGMIGAGAFVAGSQNIAGTLARLKDRKSVKIVVAGDSIAWGVQLGYTKKNYNYPIIDTRNMTYWKVLSGRLAEFYGYPKVASFLRTYDGKKQEWYDELPRPARSSRPASSRGAASQPETATAAVATTSASAPRPDADLQVIAVAVGGWTAQTGLDNIDQIINEKPDLVIWAYGANDGIFGKTEAYTAATAAAVARLKEAGIEVVLQTLPPSADLLARNWLKVRNTVEAMAEISSQARRLAAKNGCAVADMEKAFTARGILYVGDLYADFVHPNHLGHELCADVLDSLLTGRDVKTWKHGPAADKARETGRK